MNKIEFLEIRIEPEWHDVKIGDMPAAVTAKVMTVRTRVNGEEVSFRGPISQDSFESELDFIFRHAKDFIIRSFEAI